MTAIVELLRREPVRVLWIGGYLLTTAASFGLDLSMEQQTAVLGLAAALLGVGGEAVRSQVMPMQTVNERDDEFEFIYDFSPEFEEADD